MMIEDSELLRRYAVEHSEEAFAELVRRQVGLVYYAALRQTGDASLAEDVTQTVFTDLARKAASLAGRPVLTGWLYTSTRFAALKARRAERRRMFREQEAHAMQELIQDSPAADWERLRPVIDEALHTLDEREREAVLLRFFEGRSFAEVGAKLVFTEDGARKRVERALDKLHAALAQRGVTSTTAALGVALANQAGVAAPPGLAASVTGVALAGAAGGLTTTLTIMSMTKIGGAAAVIAVGAAVFWWQHQANVQLQDEVATLRAQQARAPAPAPIVREQEKPAAPKIAEPAPFAPVVPAKPPVVAPAEIDASADMVPVARFTNAGRATPRATLETNYWARKNIDLAELAKAIAFDDAAKAKAEALFGLLTDDLRGQYQTPENFAAAMLADLPSPIGIEVLEQVDQGPDDADLKLRVQNADGKFSTRTIQYHRYEDGWRTVIPAPLVDAAAKSIMQNPKSILRPKAPAPAK